MCEGECLSRRRQGTRHHYDLTIPAIKLYACPIMYSPLLVACIS